MNFDVLAPTKVRGEFKSVLNRDGPPAVNRVKKSDKPKDESAGDSQPSQRPQHRD